MLIVGGLDLVSLINRSEPELAGAIKAWRAEVRNAAWAGSKDVAARYPSAELNKENDVLFNLGHAHCVLVRVNYALKVVQMKFVGPRAEAIWPMRQTRKGPNRP